MASEPVDADGLAPMLPLDRRPRKLHPDLPPDPVMRRLAQEAAARADAPMAAVTLLQGGEARVVARVGPDPGPVADLDTLCAHTIREAEPLLVDDLSRDARFCDEPYVEGPPFVRLYAGVPVLDDTGLPLGALCVADVRPRALDSRALHALVRLARVAAAALETRRLLSPREDPARLDALLLVLLEPRVRDA